jgi:hypothetical protein
LPAKPEEERRTVADDARAPNFPVDEEVIKAETGRPGRALLFMKLAAPRRWYVFGPASNDRVEEHTPSDLKQFFAWRSEATALS